MKKASLITALCLSAGLAWPAAPLRADVSGLKGRILLAVEKQGQAWYFAPSDSMRHYLGRPDDAFRVMRGLGQGISRSDLAKLPVGILAGNDSDRDGLPDYLEIGLGTDPKQADSDRDGFSDGQELAGNFDPLGNAVRTVDVRLQSRLKGRIMLDVQGKGEAWYVNPSDGKRYFLGRPADAFQAMRSLALGIKDADLEKIPASDPDFDLALTELELHRAVNARRKDVGLPELKRNSELDAVARAHSLALANENKAFSGMGVTCDFPTIHHEGLSGAAYAQDRLAAAGLHYYSKSGENIALVTSAAIRVTFLENDPAGGMISTCAARRQKVDTAFKAELDALPGTEAKIGRVKQEIALRQSLFADEKKLEVSRVTWDSPLAAASETVQGWYDSPGHKRNMLDPDFDEAGMGAILVGPYLISTQVFIRRADCGYQDGPCCQKSGYYPYCFQPYSCQAGTCLE
jgi:uncharacterized protein YkwD